MISKNILVIENDARYLELVSSTLEKAGFAVYTATSAEVGLQLSKNVNPGLILLNLATPGTNGLDICKTIHNVDSLKSVPIILLTLREGKYDPIYQSLYGIMGFLKKPFTQGAILSTIKTALNLEDDEMPGAQITPTVPMEPSEEMPALEPLTQPEIETEQIAPEPEPIAEPMTEDAYAWPSTEEESPVKGNAWDEPVQAEEPTPGFGTSKEMPEFEIPEDTRTEESSTDFGDDTMQFNSEPASETEPHEEDDRAFSEVLSDEEEKDDYTPEEVTLSQKKPKSNKKLLIIAVLIPVVTLVALGGLYFFMGSDTPEMPPPPAPMKAAAPKAAPISNIAGLSNTPAKLSNAPVTNAASATHAVVANTPAPKVETKPVEPPVETKKIAPEQPIKKAEPAKAPEKPVVKETKPAPVKESPKKAETAKPAAKTPGNYVQFGVFSSLDNAEKLTKSLRGKGIETSMIKMHSASKGMLYRLVMKNKFDSAKSAYESTKEIERKHQITSIVYSE